LEIEILKDCSLESGKMQPNNDSDITYREPKSEQNGDPKKSAQAALILIIVIPFIMIISSATQSAVCSFIGFIVNYCICGVSLFLAVRALKNKPSEGYKILAIFIVVLDVIGLIFGLFYLMLANALWYRDLS
jgi:heme/copper-type cytochrome/quinol oxidase subunit 4